MKRVFVLHEYGAKSHFRGLKVLAEKENIELLWREFSISRHIAKGVLRMQTDLVIKQVVNLVFLIQLSFSRKKTIVLGIAPYDWRMVYLRCLLQRHHLFYFTSWPHWDRSFYPKKPTLIKPIVFEAWRKFLENSVTGIFTVTDKAKSNLKLNYDIQVDINTVYHSHEYKRKTDISETDIIKCLFVGRLIEEKGILEIIEVINKLPVENFHFSFVGNGTMEKYVQAFASQKKNVKTYGFISDSNHLLRIFEEHDILLLPSKKNPMWEELFGMVIIESMSQGIIPIATDHIGPSEIIQHNVNGFIISENNLIDAMVTTLVSLHEERESIKQLKVNAMERAEHFNSLNISKKWSPITKNLSKY